MPSTQMHSVLKHLRKVLTPCASSGSTDWELLERFVGARDESAFEILLWRHHRMVLSVCSRILADSHDVEDAFQATFLVLARKARSIRQSGSLSSWLYGVARRVALEGTRSSTLPQPSLLVAQTSGPDPCEEALRLELRRVFDKELGQLPEKYRAPVVLCYLEGMTYEQAGQQLGCSRGTVSTRLTRARELLRMRLMHRGLAVPAGTLAAWLCAQAASAATPVPLVVSTCKAASLLSAGKPLAAALSPKVAALCEGVIQAMFVTKLKIAAATLFVLAMLGAGLGTWISGNSTLAADTESAQNKATVVSAQKGSKSDQEAIQGTWKVMTCELGGQQVATEDFSMVITANKIFIKDEGLTKEFAYTLDPSKKPRHIDWVPAFGVNKGNIVRGIYRLNGDDLVFCTNGPQGKIRPGEFKTAAGSQVALMVLKRDKPARGADKSSRGPVINEVLDDKELARKWEKLWLDMAQHQGPHEFDMGKWEVDLNEVHRNPMFKNTCVLCHQRHQLKKEKGPDLDKLIIKQFGDLALIRLPKKKGPAADADFLRRLCLDVLGRTPTPLEMHYFLKDSDPEKHRKVAERLLNQDGSPFALIKVKPQADRSARAEEYIKKQLGKEKLSAADRRILQIMLDFMDREQAGNLNRADVLRLWMEFFSTPAAEPRKH